eukprot:CAMPEP_0204108020 /NCGR_PEP_ID=MMETSP0361-20130328/472_1 /ASSEMBLY_ACC=CAM_ASM_000343 /TAXON_ID=268821 /ORGANISM="Scrippsiella Hangoei, Strain SHTV-5" /LENGTH=306 /DNA_ID=CAMNT_0051057583 /DNA_START=11 /DNA_END=928 /DNA_ORIENTATION=+
MTEVPGDLEDVAQVVLLSSDGAAPAAVLEAAAKLVLCAADLLLEGGEPPDVLFVTQRTQSAHDDDYVGPGVPLHAGLWGLARCLRLQHPGLRIGCLDLGAWEGPMPAEAIARALQTLSLQREGGLEEELIARGAMLDDDGDVGGGDVEVHVARLTEGDASALRGVWPASFFEANGTYLWAGAGAIALQVACWSAEQGARHVVLVSRSGIAAAGMEPWFRKLAASPDMQVVLKQCDICAKEFVARCFGELETEMPPIKGIFHAAKGKDSSPIENWDRRCIAEAISAKVDGALNLHVLSQERCPDLEF